MRADLQRLRRDTDNRRYARASAGTGSGVSSNEAAGDAKHNVTDFLPWRRSRPRFMAAIAAVVGLAAVAAVWFGSWHRGSGKPARSHTTVAVLPFQNMSDDRSHDYLRLAIPDQVTTDLSYSPSLAIRPASLAQRFIGEQIDPRAAGKELRVSLTCSPKSAHN